MSSGWGLIIRRQFAEWEAAGYIQDIPQVKESKKYPALECGLLEKIKVN